MKSETIKKINTFGKVGYIICKIGRIAAVIGAVTCLVCGVLMCFFPKDAVKIELTTSNTATIQLDTDHDLSSFFDLDIEGGILEIGENTYKVMANDADEPATVTSTIYISNFKWILFVGVLACAATLFVFYFAEKLCGYFKRCETPFTEDISMQLTRLAWSLIPMCVLSSAMESITDSLMTGTLDISLDIDLVYILLVLCVFMLSYIFKHGTALQTETDELL